MDFKSENKRAFREGIRDGMPIGLGYIAVSFSLGILAKDAGFTAAEGFLASFLGHASAGEYAFFTSVAENAPLLLVMAAVFVANARYLLMSCALSQRFAPGTKTGHRLLIGFGLTDELFGITIARGGAINPYYTYGAMLITFPMWASGTALGITFGNILPARVVSALSVALYGMFLAIIIPPARKSKTIAVLVVVSFAVSWAASRLPGIRSLSSATRIIILTVAIAAVAAVLRPAKELPDE